MNNYKLLLSSAGHCLIENYNSCQDGDRQWARACADAEQTLRVLAEALRCDFAAGRR